MKPKIFLWCVPASGWGPSDVIGYALAEDGTGLASHLSSNELFSKHDMGLTSDWKHKTYKEHYPDGFELVWIDDAERGGNPEFEEAYQKNQKKGK
jgi:hypothetical protein